MGRAAIAALRQLKRAKRTGRGEAAWPAARAALEFVRDVLPMLPARAMPVGERARLPPIILYTDAMYRPSGRVSSEVAAIGAAWFDSTTIGEVDEATGAVSTGWKHLSMDVPEDILAAWGEGKTKIGQAEALAPVVALLADPEAFRDREVVSYIDNTGVLFGYAKGCSRDVPTARLVHTFHAMSAALGAQVWFSYVPSKANLADLPSRGEFDLLRELGSRDVMEGRSAGGSPGRRAGLGLDAAAGVRGLRAGAHEAREEVASRGPRGCVAGACAACVAEAGASIVRLLLPPSGLVRWS